MTGDPPLSFGRLSSATAAARLSDAAGWDVGVEDWRRLLAVPTCTVLGGYLDDALVATGTVVRYPPDMAWLGMFLVAPDRRRRGHGTAIYRRALALATADADRVGLDANDAGYPLYRDEFADAAAVEQWRGSPRFPDGPPAAATADANTLRSLDAEAVAADRSALLDRLSGEPDTLAVAVPPGRPSGYAVVRPAGDAVQVGPAVAPDAAAFGTLLDAALACVDADEAVVNAPAPSDATRRVLRDRGLSPVRTLTRMTHPDPTDLLLGPTVYAIAGFAWG